MKKSLLYLSISIAFITNTNAQSIEDSASTGASYANQAWYSLNNGTLQTNAIADWDIAFQINGFTSPILFNTANGAELYVYPKGDTAAWSTMDTIGINSWTATFNNEDSWERGAFNGILSNDAFDLGWGRYNQITHQVTGDSLFIAKYPNGQIKKIWIENLISGKYNFKVSDLNGSNLVSRSLNKANFSSKNFGYYSILNDSILDVEPTRNLWDLLFTKYTAFIPIPYGVTGVIQNSGVKAVKVYPVNDPFIFQNYMSQSFTSDINTIGYDWKSYSFAINGYEIADSTVYFVKAKDSTIWKVIMTGFGGSSNGNFYFSKEQLTTTSIIENQNDNGKFFVYPNPARINESVSLVTDLPAGIINANLSIVSINGQLISEENIQINSTFDQNKISIPNLKAGVYFVRLAHSKGSITQKLIIQ